MANIMQTISSKISDNQEAMAGDNLMEEATNICDSMKGNPLFSSLMGMQNDMMANMMPQQPAQDNTTRKIQVGDKNHDPNRTKERLQKKLKEKTTVEKKE